MDHVAVMKKDWGFIEKILSGKKTIESRWYFVKHLPWNGIHTGDRIYFKNTGGLVSARAEVKKVIQFENLNPTKVKEILGKYGKNIGIPVRNASYSDAGGEKRDAKTFYKMFANKKYCILVFLENPKKISEFNISKKGFGAMASWMSVKNISEIKV